MSIPEWFLFLYFKYWYFRSLKRFWDYDFNLVNAGADPGFQVRGGPLREARKCLWYFVWKITILRQKIIFFPILGGGGAGCAPPGSAAAMSLNFIKAWRNDKSFDLAFHFSFNQNKLWKNWRSNRALLYNKPSILYQWK